ncbi:hypothetical protein P691DRAFT_795305 [Macrolepiota fuliginosa MF-IS2]|uniref:Uncharacterized protein n=1 Tax=Macrolepiota fuliginosa MF-IS2 TaxID=1400762 RepID=A0A9P5WY14_9AGAR|nr:hypothetical protein P691DRAFT_795305 [Macrolepiota fuliginosa MF-IS2]
MCATAIVPSTSDLNIIEATLSDGLLRIIDVPFFKPGSTKPILSTEVGAQLQQSIIPSNYVVHWRFIRNSPKAEFATVWINLSDSQRGTRASQLIGHCLFLNEAECQHCWHWGHNTEVCRCPAIRCPICTGPHSKASNPKVTPPIPPTLADMPCMHVCSCINYNHRCPYWRHRFNRSWIQDQAIQDASACKGVPPPSSTP